MLAYLKVNKDIYPELVTVFYYLFFHLKEKKIIFIISKNRCYFIKFLSGSRAQPKHPLASNDAKDYKNRFVNGPYITININNDK